jgi:hypothetical protein
MERDGSAARNYVPANNGQGPSQLTLELGGLDRLIYYKQGRYAVPTLTAARKAAGTSRDCSSTCSSCCLPVVRQPKFHRDLPSPPIPMLDNIPATAPPSTIPMIRTPIVP